MFKDSLKMKTKAIAFLALCISASAAPLPPFPTTTVKRPVPLLSPKAASIPKSTPMFKPASSELPRVPMMVEVTPASDGRVTLLVDAFKPANTTMAFYYGPTPAGPWSHLQFWGVYPEAQWVGVGWTTREQPVFVRAAHNVMAPGSSATMAPLLAPEGVIRLPPSKTKPKRLQ